MRYKNGVWQSVFGCITLLSFMLEVRCTFVKKERKNLNILIGHRLQIVRENGGYTQEEFAEVLDISVEHYRKVELGVYGLQRENMLLLYRKYKIDPTFLITGERNYAFDFELFIINCSREERDQFIDRMFAYMRKLMTISF